MEQADPREPARSSLISSLFPSNAERKDPDERTSSDRNPGGFPEFGSPQIQGGLTPKQKAAHLTALMQAGHRVGFVGDGVNDAAAMREASVGIALAHGAGVTTTGAGAVLYGGDLRTLPWAVALSRQVRNSIRSNLLFAAAYNALGIALAATGLLHPVASALLMVVSSFTVSWRALRSTESVRACCTPQREEPDAKHAESSPSSQESSPVRSSGFGRPTRFLAGEQFQKEQGTRLEPAPRALASDLGLRIPFGTRPAGFSLHSGSNHRALPRSQIIAALLVLAQAPLLSGLGRMNMTSSLLTGAVMCALSGSILLFRSDNLEWKRLAHMAFAMVGWGNWGMLLGWWADSGFGSISGGCANCVAGGFDLGGFLHAPWMNLGMLLFGLPSMLIRSVPATVLPGNVTTTPPSVLTLSSPTPLATRGEGLFERIVVGLLSAGGMIWGMAFGDYVCMNWLGPATSERVLLAWLGMTIGMLLGMFLCCEVGRTVLLWKRKSH